MGEEIAGLYFITDSRLSQQGILQDVRLVLAAGCRIVQYREKGKGTAEMVREALEIKKMCGEKGALFLINDRLDVALAVDADGVHLGQEDASIADARKQLGKDRVIGVTVHNVEEAMQAQKEKADYVSISPIFHTDTKKDAGEPAGLELVRKVKEGVRVPVVAIGGIGEGNVQEVLRAGADSVAMVSAIVSSGNVGEAAERILRKISEVQ